MRKSVVVILVAALLLVVWPVHAQDGDGEADTDLTRAEMIDLVITAYDNLRAAQYYSFEINQTQEQVVGSGVGLRRATLHTESVISDASGQVQLDPSGELVASELSMTQTTITYVQDQDRNALDIALTLELILLDGTLYMQVTEVSGEIHETALEDIGNEDRMDEVLATFPTGWVNMSESPETMQGYLSYLTDGEEIPLLEGLNLEALTEIGTTPALTPEMFVAISEGESTADTYIFNVELDASMYYEAMGLSAVIDDETLAGDATSMLEQLFAGMTISQEITLTITENSVLPERVETAILVDVSFSEEATDGVPLDLTMETDSTLTYSSIGNEFEITAPETGSPEAAETEASN
ncbi:MAG: hypothetical protein GYB66_13025 [Chloroflexi bacterium]|nr:hypothetical protein [Chloroflexota bacterium]